MRRIKQFQRCGVSPQFALPNSAQFFYLQPQQWKDPWSGHTLADVSNPSSASTMHFYSVMPFGHWIFSQLQCLSVIHTFTDGLAQKWRVAQFTFPQHENAAHKTGILPLQPSFCTGLPRQVLVFIHWIPGSVGERSKK